MHTCVNIVAATTNRAMPSRLRVIVLWVFYSATFLWDNKLIICINMIWRSVLRLNTRRMVMFLRLNLTALLGFFPTLSLCEMIPEYTEIDFP